MKNPFAKFSRATKVVVLVGMVLALVAATGVLNVARGVEIPKERAISIARSQITYEPAQTTVRLVRRGFSSTAFWAVSFSIPDPSGVGYDRLTTVLVHAGTGSIAGVEHEP